MAGPAGVSATVFSAQRGDRFGNAERQPGRAQPAEQPVLGAGLLRRQVLADPQHPAAAAVRHREGLVVGAALGPGQFGFRRDAPAGEQPGRGFEARPGHHDPSLGGRAWLSPGRRPSPAPCWHWRACYVAVTFGAEGSQTLVRLEHTGWEAFDDPAAARAEYDHGWPLVLGRYQEHVAEAGDS